MKPLARRGVHKGRSAKQFRHRVSRVHGRNMMPTPMRGGWRM